MTVLILADDGDPSVDLVVEELRKREWPTARFDTGAFPTSLDLDATLDSGRWTGRLQTPHRCVELEAITSIWRRSPTAFQFPASLSGPERQHAATEAKLGLGGVLLALPVPWLDRPDLTATATYKPLQLSVATDVGLSVPPTLVTNRADAVRTFCRPRRAVTKMLGSPGIHESGGRRIAYTEQVTAPMLGQLDGIATTAHQFQQWVDKAFEVRVVVVGATLFAVSIHAGSPAAHIDWRADYPNLSYEVVAPPADVRDGVDTLMARLGLRYGALDFAVDHDGRWWFLEFTDRPVLRTSRSWRPVSGRSVDRLPARSGTSVLLRWVDGTCGADGAGRGSEGAVDQPRWGLAILDGAVARGGCARGGGSVLAAA